MQSWLGVSLLLCSYGFLRELRPSEPFVTDYMSGPRFNATKDDIIKEVYPIGTYSVLAQVVVVFLITDILRYKPVIVASSLAGIALFAVLLWAHSLWELKLGQIFYGTFMASEVAYYTYIYAKVPKCRYTLVTGQTRSAILGGKFLGGVLAQVLVSTAAASYRGLHFISFGTQILSLGVALALPSVRQSVYFYAVDAPVTVESGMALEAAPPVAVVAATAESPRFSWRKASRLLLQHTLAAYSNPVVVQWSVWWALATCGQLMVVSYVQFLWLEIDPLHENFYNGGVEALVTLCGAGAAMTAGHTNNERHKRWHLWILTLCSMLMGAFLVISGVTNLVWVAYAMYVLFGICYFYVITIASAIVAENLSDDSFGLIFGINTLVALILQTVLTLAVVTKNVGFGLPPRDQYVVYGVYFLALSIIYCVGAMLRRTFQGDAASQGSPGKEKEPPLELDSKAVVQ